MVELAKEGEYLYLAVIGDLRRSRAATDRDRVQDRLEAALARVSHEQAEALASSLVITVGDEFQGLLHHPAAVLDLLTGYEAGMFASPTRFGLGWGTLSTKLKPTAIGMDGPCFHAARAALERGKAEDRWVTVEGFGERRDQILNGIFALLGSVRSEWTVTQAETIAQMRSVATQKEVARRRGVAASTVHKALRGALYAPLIEAEASLRLLFEEYGR